MSTLRPTHPPRARHEKSIAYTKSFIESFEDSLPKKPPANTKEMRPGQREKLLSAIPRDSAFRSQFGRVAGGGEFCHCPLDGSRWRCCACVRETHTPRIRHSAFNRAVSRAPRVFYCHARSRQRATNTTNTTIKNQPVIILRNFKSK